MTRVGGWLLGSMALLLAGEAVAQTSGPYIALGVGANFRQDAELTLRGTGAALARRMGMEPEGRIHFGGASPAVLGSLGWGFGTLRAEAEFSYRSHDADSVSLTGIPGDASLSGSASTYAAMANLFYDAAALRFTAGVPVTPYIGLGGGYAWSSYDEVRLRSRRAGAATYGVDGGFAYQAMAGLNWDLSRLAPGLSLTTEYRYFAVLDQTVSFGAQVGRFGFRDANVEVTNRNHAVLLGLRYAFRTPAP